MSKKEFELPKGPDLVAYLESIENRTTHKAINQTDYEIIYLDNFFRDFEDEVPEDTLDEESQRLWTNYQAMRFRERVTQTKSRSSLGAEKVFKENMTLKTLAKTAKGISNQLDELVEANTDASAYKGRLNDLVLQWAEIADFSKVAVEMNE